MPRRAGCRRAAAPRSRRRSRRCPAPRRRPAGRSRSGRPGPRPSAGGPGGPRPRRGPRGRGPGRAPPTARRPRAAGGGAARGPTREAKVCSAGPPAARRRRTVSRIASACGRWPRAAASVTCSTQPSISASSVSRRTRAASWAGRVVRLEQPAGQRLLDRRRVAAVDVAHGRLDRVGVDGDAAGVGLDRAEHLRPEPGHVGEQPGPGRLAQPEVEPHLVGRDVQPLAERLDVVRQQRHGAVGDERQPDLGAADHLAGQGADGLADLQPEDAAAHLADHRAGHLGHLLLHAGQLGQLRRGLLAASPRPSPGPRSRRPARPAAARPAGCPRPTRPGSRSGPGRRRRTAS